MNTLENNTQKTGRGVPRNGFRMTTNRRLQMEAAKAHGIEIDMDDFKAKPDFLQNLITQKASMPVHIPVEESYEDVRLKVQERFKVIEEITLSVCMGVSPAMILCGAGGVGKSSIVKKTIKELGLTDVKYINGKVSPSALYRLAYESRHRDSLIVFDDSDDVFFDDTSLQILKQITDSSEDRQVSWHSNRTMFDEEGREIPTDFEFNGSVIFISNIDFYREAEGNNKLAPHMKALISRSFVLDVDMKNHNYYLARLQDVLFDYMDESVYSLDIKNSIFDFMNKEKNSLRELSLRMVKKIRTLQMTYGPEWQSKAKIVLCK